MSSTAATGRTATVEGVAVPTDHLIGGRRVPSADGRTFDGALAAGLGRGAWPTSPPAAGPRSTRPSPPRAPRFPAWAALGPEGRHPILDALADAVGRRRARPGRGRDGRQRLAAGGDARCACFPRGANNIRFFADFAVERLAEPPRTLHGGERNRVRHDPAGVVAVSTPWNAPFMLATWRVGPRWPPGTPWSSSRRSGRR